MARPSVLAVSSLPVDRDVDGFTVRARGLLRGLGPSWEITLLAPRTPGGESQPPEGVANWIELPQELIYRGVTRPSSRHASALVERVAGAVRDASPDVVLFWIGTEFAASGSGGLPIVADRVDCLWLGAWRQSIAGGLRERLSSMRTLVEYARFERYVARRMQATVVVGEDDARALRRIAPGASVHVVSNGVEARGRWDAALESPEPRVVFSGVMDYRPNIDAVRHFVRHVWPAIRHAVPDATFAIAGRRPTSAVRELADEPGVVLEADVPDMNATLAEAWVCVAPMVSGTGVKNKVLEAWACGKPVVMTPMAANGLQPLPFIDESIGASPAAFAETVVRLLRSSSARRDLAAHSFECVTTHHAWSRAADGMGAIIRGVIAMHGDG